MPGKGDISFTFDASSFEKGMKKIGGDMSKTAQNTENIAGKMQKGMSRALTSVALKAVAIIGAVKGIISAVKTYLPEVGTTFQIAGNIILKNFLHPLRMQVLPMLNKFLDWTRKHRADFVKFGGVLANAFKAVLTILKTLGKALEPILRPILDAVRKYVGGSVDDISETINMLLVKVTALVIFLADLLKPVFDTLGQMLGATIKALETFFKGFAEGFLAMGGDETLQQLVNLFQSLLGLVQDLTPAFGELAKILGGTVAVALKAILGLITATVDGMRMWVEMFKDPKAFFEQFKGMSAMEVIFGDPEYWKKTFGISPKEMTSPNPTQVDDAIITKGGQVIKTNPADTIVALKSPSMSAAGPAGGGSGQEINVYTTFGDIIVSEGDARRTGEEVGIGIAESIRRALLGERSAEAL